MKSKVFVIAIILLSASQTNAQGSFEQYLYIQKNKTLTWAPIIRYKTRKNWYSEIRYNYEHQNTLSIYAGKMFSHEGTLSYSATPLLGGVVGIFKGGSIGLNLAADFHDFFFSSQSQFTFSGDAESQDFIFSWSELLYHHISWLYWGLSTQHTYFNQPDIGSFEPGAVVGFEIGKWTFPFYGFNLTTDNKYFVVGVNLDLGTKIIHK